MTLNEVADLALHTGHQGICMRASQIGVDSSLAEMDAATRSLSQRGLKTTMATGNFDIVYNNDHGPNCLRNIAPFLTLARRLKAPLIRVPLKSEADIAWAQTAADQAKDDDVGLVSQCHTRSLFETVDQIEEVLKKINRPNFGLIYEPANLELCGQDYGPETIARLSPWIRNVYLQNQVLDPQGSIELNTWIRGPVRFRLISVHEPGGIRFEKVFQGLKQVGYDGTVTIHQSPPEGQSPSLSTRKSADFVRSFFA